MNSYEVVARVIRAIDRHGVVKASSVLSGDSIDFFRIIDSMAQAGLIHIVNHPDSDWGQHQLIVKPLEK